MLCQDRLSLDAFQAWWGKTNIDRDFWVETASTWVRVHMVPRRATFNPSTWRTGSTVLRDMLVASIGSTRMTECVCCRSGKWIESTVDQWTPDQVDQHVFPLLWVGRTVFYKLKPPGPSHRDPGATDGSCAMPGQGRAVEPHDEAAAPVRSGQGGGHSPPLLECPRAAGHDQGAHQHPRREDGGPTHEGTQLHDDAGAT